MNRDPFVDWDSVPIVMGVKDAARVLNRSTSWLYRKLESGAHVPGLMPREGSDCEYQFSKKKLRDYLEGGYANFSRIRKAS
jgi:hypothetical protein